MTKKLVSSLALSLILGVSSLSFAEEHKKHHAEAEKSHAEMKTEEGKAHHHGEHHHESKEAKTKESK